MEKTGGEKPRILPRPIRWIRARLTDFDHKSMIAGVRFRFPVVTAFLRVLTVSAQGTSWAIAIGVLALGIYGGWFHFPAQWQYLAALVAPGVAWIFVKMLKTFWRRPRPFQSIENYRSLAYAPSDESFPSGHTASAFAFLVALLSFAAPMVIPIVAAWAVVIAVSRWYLGVHYPTDILAGAAIGALSGLAHSTMIEVFTRLFPGWSPL